MNLILMEQEIFTFFFQLFTHAGREGSGRRRSTVLLSHERWSVVSVEGRSGTAEVAVRSWAPHVGWAHTSRRHLELKTNYNRGRDS